MTLPVPGSLIYSHNADGVTTVFPYPVRFLEAGELLVIREDSAGAQTVQSYNTDYAVSGAGNPAGGAVTFLAVPVGGKVLITRNTAAKQLVDLEDTKRTPSEAVELQLDRLAMVDQDHGRDIGRSMKTALGASPIPLEHFPISSGGGNFRDGGPAANIGEALAQVVEGRDRAEVAADISEAARDAALAAAAGVNLPPVAANTMLVDNAAGTARESKGLPDVRKVLKTAPCVSSMAELRALDTSKDTAAVVVGSRAYGTFSWDGAAQTAGNVSRPVGASTAVASSTFTMTPHRLLRGQAVCVTSAANGLSTETIYYVIKVTDNTFKLATTFANAVAGTAITLTGTTNMTFLRLMDPLQAIYVIPTGKSITGSDGAWVRNEYLTNYDLHVAWFGAAGDGVSDDTRAIFFMLDFCEKQLRLTRFGGRCVLSKGTYLLTSMIRIGTSTILQGAGMYASTLYFGPSYTAGNCIELGPDNVVDASGASVYGYFANYTFNTLLMDLDIKGGNVYRGADKALVYTQGAHQPSGLYRCFVREVVSYGIHWNLGNGGPANFTISHCDIEAGTTIPSTGSKTGIICTGGGAIIDMDTVNIQGGGGTLAIGVFMQKDHLNARGLHFENCTTGISLGQNETLPLSNTIIGASGHSTVPTLISRNNPTKNTLVAINVGNTSIGTTGLVVIRNNGVNLFSDTVVPFWNSGP